MKDWKTTVSGWAATFFWALAYVAVIPYDSGSELALLIPPTWRPKMIIIMAILHIATKAYRDYQAKDK